MWDLPGPGLEPVSPALAGKFLTTVPPVKPIDFDDFLKFALKHFWDENTIIIRQWNETQRESQVWRGKLDYVNIDSPSNQWVVTLVENAHVASLSW